MQIAENYFSYRITAMYVVDLIPLGVDIPYPYLSYSSREDIPYGSIVYVQVRKKMIPALVFRSDPIRERKQDLKKMSHHLQRVSLENLSKKIFFSREFTSLIPELSSYYRLYPSRFLLLTSPKRILRGNSEYLREHSFKKSRERNLRFFCGDEKKRTLELLNAIHLFKEEKKASVQIIVPSEMQGRFFLSKMQENNRIHFIHGGLSEKKFKKIISEISDDRPKIIITTPQYLDIPLYRKGLVVLEYENSEHYRSFGEPHIDFRILISEYTKRAKIDLYVSGDFISHKGRYRDDQTEEGGDIYRDEKTELVLFYKTEVEKKNDGERIREILRKERDDYFIFNDYLEKKIENAIENREKIFFYAQKKYYASQMLCIDCGNILKKGERPIKIKRNGKAYSFIDPNTEEKIETFDLCPVCGSWRMKMLGIGSERIFDYLKERFPKRKIFLIDSEQIKTKTEMKEVLEDIEKNEASIVVGTKLALPYLKDKRIKKTFIASLDVYFFLSIPNQEETYLSILKEIESFSDRIFLQTRLKKHTDLYGKKVVDNHPFREEFVQLLRKKLKQLGQGLEKKEKYTEGLKLWNFFKKKPGYYPINEYIPKQGKRFFILDFRRREEKDIFLKEISKYAGEDSFELIRMRSNKVMLVTDEKNWLPFQQDRILKEELPFHGKSVTISIY